MSAPNSGMFAISIQKFADKTKEDIGQVVRKVVIDVGTRLVERTPVGDPSNWLSLHPYVDLKTGKDKLGGKPPAGYVGGRARGSWQHGFNTVPAGGPGFVDPSGDEANARIAASVAASPVGGIHYIASNLDYMPALENGHSTQAPNGMVALTAIEFESIVADAVQAVKK